MKRLPLLIALTLWVGGALTQASPIDGKSGRELMMSVRDAYRPRTTLGLLSGSDGLFAGIIDVFRGPKGGVVDPYTGIEYPCEYDESLPEALSVTHIAPMAWWGVGEFESGSMSMDLNNITPCAIDVPERKRDFPPGSLVETTYDNGAWSVGYGVLLDEKIDLYSPPKGYEGDFARAIFYMLTVYPCDLWRGVGANFLLDCDFPILQPWARRQLLAWHHADPVDISELDRDSKIAGIQGSGNPYVTLEKLADHIWGDLSSEPWAPEDESGVNPEPRVPLKAVYDIDEPRIDLYSPYIAADATWSVDGEMVNADHLVPREIGPGRHELRYEAPASRGKLIIMINGR